MALVGCVVGGYGAWTISSVTGQVSLLLEREMVVAIAVLRSQNHMIRMGSSVAGLLAAETPDVAKIHEAAEARLRDNADRLAEMRAASSEGAIDADRIQSGFDTVRAVTSKMLALLDSGDFAQARTVFSSALAPELERQATVTRERVEEKLVALSTRRNAVLQAASSARIMLIGAAGLPVVFALAGFLWINGPGLRRPMKRLADATQKLRHGEYGEAVVGADRQDEIGVVASILEKLRHEALRASALEKQAKTRENEAEAARLRDLTNAAFEGIAICDGELVTEANTSLAAIVGQTRGDLVGGSIHSLFRNEDGTYLDGVIEIADGKPIAGVIMSADGPAPAEIRVRRLIGREQQRRVIITARDLREQRAAEERVRFLAYHDPLTGMGNRAMLRERLDQAFAVAKRSGEHVAVLLLDLDNFKHINDIHGHMSGDMLLKEAARRILSSVRETDTVVRSGGDEFAIVQVGMAQANAAEFLAQRLVEQLGQTFDLGDGVHSAISVSVGVAVYPENAKDPEALVTFAEAALHKVKSSGRANYAFFKPEMDAELRLRAALEHDLRAALAGHQFTLAYQPQAETATGDIVGFEALLRWNHPTRGPIPPSDFIPIAESIGLIPEIGAWVLRTACVEAATWSRKLRIAVNVSPLQIERAEFATLVETTLAETGIDPGRLEIEITESTFVRDSTMTIRIMRALKALGVKVAIDDFGTGYSSLSTLHTFAFDRVKVDRSFVLDMPANPRATAVVRAVVALGHSLGLPVIAEGVETNEQRAALEAEGCEEIQGYLIGKPLAIEAFRFVTNPAKQGKPVMVAA